MAPAEGAVPRRPAPPAAASGAAADQVFYDGGCGLCHRFVRFVAARDGEGAFRFAPLAGATFRSLMGTVPPADLPDSVVVRAADGRMLLRSAAVLHVLARLGGGWRVAGRALRLVPRPLRDAVYDLVAAARSRLFKRPAAACPVVPAHLRDRFLP